ncbi:MAG: hypothetical protein K2N85_03025 [Lachnospiraceae bacterium]|nr:hypothetical protein [Lachnospiraceae bacterium]
MKKVKSIMIALLSVIVMGCSNSNSTSDSQIIDNAEQTDTGEVNTENAIDTEEEPSWAIGTQMEGELFQNLNLDGIGEADDEAYVSVYQFGDYEDKVTVIRIHLGTGETMAQVLPVYGDYSFLTGRLFSEEKDAIILEVQVPASNYGAATVFVLDVNPVGADPIPTVTTRLDTENSITLADENVLDNSFITNSVTDGTKVVDVSDMPRQGVSIYFLDENGRYQGLQRIFYWTDDGWTVIPEEVQERLANRKMGRLPRFRGAVKG